MADSFVADSFVPDARQPSPEMGVGETLARGTGLGAIADTLGIGRQEARTPVGVVLNPQTPAEQFASWAATTLPVARAGMLAAKVAPAAARAVAPAVGRILGSGAVGAAQGAYKGTGATSEGLMDMTASTLAEGIGGLAPKAMVGGIGRTIADAMSKSGGAQWARDAAVDGIRQLRLQNIPVRISILGNAVMRAEDAAVRIGELEGGAFKVARQELLEAIENQVSSGMAAKLAMFLPEYRVAAKPLWTAGNNAGRAGMDAAASAIPEATLGLALQAAPSFGGMATHLAPHMMGR